MKDVSEFIRKSNLVHGCKYNYEEVIICSNSAKNKVSIVCPLHGSFSQRPRDHLQGRGCPSCKKDTLAGLRRLSQEGFLSKAIKIHGKKYDYSKIKYIESSKHVIIICPLHGEFLQRPNDHLCGKGCGICGRLKGDASRALTNDEFIIRAKNVHFDKYNYSCTDYKNGSTKVSIICSKHGMFLQLPINHLAGNGCPKCKESKGEQRIRRFLTQNNFKFESQVKFKSLKHKRSLIFDFLIEAIPGKKFLLEYNGQQHYRPSTGLWKNSIKQFEVIKVRDILKVNWCKDNGISLFIISYKEFDKIEEKIIEIINRHDSSLPLG